jgi:uncharacterized membrane protein YraQ (UPF0718 family)
MANTIKQKLPTRTWWGVLAGIAIVYSLFGVRMLTARNLTVHLPNHVQDVITLAASVIIESLPFVLVGILLSIVVQVWLPDGVIIKYLPKQPTLRRACISLLGVFMPVCECGNLPLARGLIVKGLTVPESLVFLLAAPILNPITIITTHQAFGSDSAVLVARVAGGFIIANTIGWLYAKHTNPESLLTPEFAASCKLPSHHSHEGKVDASLRIFRSEAASILPVLFISALAAGLIQVLVPRSILLGLGSNPVWSILAMMALAFIVSICSNVDAFFALAFSSTFTVGSIVSFLTFGPIIDIKMLGLMRTTYRTKVLVQITALVTLITLLMGLVVNYAF